MPTWAPKVCKIVAFRAIIRGLGLLFYILLGFRYGFKYLNMRSFCAKPIQIIIFGTYNPSIRGLESEGY